MKNRTTSIHTSCDICSNNLNTDQLQIIIYYPVFFANKTRVFCVCRGCYQKIDNMNYEEIMQFWEESKEAEQ